MSGEPAEPCALFGRGVRERTRHHLIPRTRHGNRRNKRDVDRREVRERIVWLCRPCHERVHAVLTEKVLEREFDTLEKLASHPEIARFVVWVRGKPDGTHVVARQTRRRRS